MKRLLPGHYTPLTTEQGLTVFFVFLLIYVLMSIPLAGLTYGKLVAQTIVIIGFIISFRLFFRPGLKRKVTVSLAVSALALLWLIHFRPSLIIAISHSIILVLMWLLLATEILGHVLREGPITWHRIRGAASLYLFFGLLLAEFYWLVETSVPGAFQLPLGMGKDPETLYAQMVYFSFITQTTVGYGDIIPLHPFARMLVTLQALVGQFYPAVVMGWLVSQEVIHRTENR